MILVHVGIKPEHATFPETVGLHKYQIEKMPDGSSKLWTGRMLTSGCNQEVSEIEGEDNLIYCNHCDEWFSKNQFKEK